MTSAQANRHFFPDPSISSISSKSSSRHRVSPSHGGRASSGAQISPMEQAKYTHYHGVYKKQNKYKAYNSTSLLGMFLSVVLLLVFVVTLMTCYQTLKPLMLKSFKFYLSTLDSSKIRLMKDLSAEDFDAYFRATNAVLVPSSNSNSLESVAGLAGLGGRLSSAPHQFHFVMADFLQSCSQGEESCSRSEVSGGVLFSEDMTCSSRGYDEVEARLKEAFEALQRYLHPPSLQQFTTKVRRPLVDFSKAPVNITLTNSNNQPFHSQRERWVELLHGSIKWILYRPSTFPAVGYNTNMSVSDWMQQVYPSLKGAEKPIECTQQAGQVLYLPEGWYAGHMITEEVVYVSQLSEEYVKEGLLGNLDLSSSLLDSHFHEQAIEKSREGLKHGVHVDLLNVLAKSLFLTGEYEQAEKVFRQAIKTCKLHPAAYCGLLELQLRQERYEDAKSTFLSAEKMKITHIKCFEESRRFFSKLKSLFDSVS